MPDPTPAAELDARFSEPGATATPWSTVERVLAEAELSWISTTKDDGQPHVTPLPTVWDDGSLHFCTGAAEQKGVNLARNARCALTTGTNTWKVGLDVVVEGLARQVVDEDRLRHLAGQWLAKYGSDWTFTVADGAFHHEGGGTALVFAVAPTKVLAFAKGDFAQTRYRF
jgi:hypothetical protein